MESKDLIYSQPEALSQCTPPIVPPPELQPLAPEEKASAIALIKAAGEEGLDVGGETGLKFVWKQKCSIGFGQRRERKSDQLCLRNKSMDCRPICTYEGC